MKKNFFKKLSFVLVLAMVLSVFTPAAGALAAKAPKLNATKKYLHLKNSKTGKYDFNIANKKSGWKYKWTSANTKVAKVNSKNGVVTAAGVGTTTVSVKITDAKGKAVKTLKATVVVRDNITEVKISNPLAENATLKVGEAYDFNRSFTTASGSTTKTSGVTRWAVSQKDVDEVQATIDDKGIFKAETAGEYTVIARSFQSKAKYEDWLKDTTKEALVTATSEEVTVKVVPSVLSTKQIDKSSFEVEFDTDMSKTDFAKLSAIYRMVGDKEVTSGAEKVKEVKFDGKKATVVMFAPLNSETTYKFKFETLEGEFTTAKVDPTEIVSIRFKEDPIKVKAGIEGKDLYKELVAVNKDDVIIYTGEELKSYLTITSDDNGKYQSYVNNGTLVIYDVGVEATVKAAYSEFVYNADEKAYKEVKAETVAKAIGVKEDNSIVAGSIGYKLAKPGALAPTADDIKKDADWKTSFTVAKNETVYVLARLKKANDKDNFKLADDFSYESTNAEVALVSGTAIYFAKEGKVTIIVKDADGKRIDTFDVTVIGERVLASVAVDGTPSKVIGNAVDTDIRQTAEFKFIAKDNLGEVVKGITVNPVQKAPTSPLLPHANSDTITNADGEAVVKIDGYPANSADPAIAAGTYTFEVEFIQGDKKIVQRINVVLVKADANVAKWAVELKGETDIKEGADEIEVTVNGYNAAGARTKSLVYDATSTPSVDNAFEIKLAKEGTDKSSAVVAGKIKVADIGVGTYSVTAIVNKGAGTHVTGRQDAAPIATTILTIKDSNEKSVSVKTQKVSAADYANIEALVKAQLVFTLNGKEVDLNTVSIGAIKAATPTNGNANGSTLIAGNITSDTDIIIKTVVVNGIEYEVNKIFKVTK